MDAKWKKYIIYRDEETALAFVSTKQDVDPLFYYKYDVDEKIDYVSFFGHIQGPMWISRYTVIY